jgi:hypothetical protein
MGVSISGKIVTDGLVIHLDALNGRSYSGSGTTWNDLTHYANNGDLNGGTNPVSIQNGYAFFSGVNSSEIVDFDSIEGINTTTNYVTVDMWAKIKTPATPNIEGSMFGWNVYSMTFRLFGGGGNLRYLGFDTAINDQYGINTADLESLDILDNWKHYCFVFVNGAPTQGNLPKENQKIYVNSIGQSLSQVAGSDTPAGRLFASSGHANARFPGIRFGAGANRLVNMDVALVKVYNRELTQAEVTQNFNAHKGRFNIY